VLNSLAAENFEQEDEDDALFLDVDLDAIVEKSSTSEPQQPSTSIDEPPAPTEAQRLSFGEMLLAGSSNKSKPVVMTKPDDEARSQMKQNLSKLNSRFDGTLREDLLLSSDEEEEARYPMEARFNEYGRDVRRIAHKRRRSEVDAEFEREEKLARMKEKIYRDERAKPHQGSTSGGLKNSGYSLAKSLNVDNDLGSDGFVQGTTRIRIV
jgi:hypothetical protein